MFSLSGAVEIGLGLIGTNYSSAEEHGIKVFQELKQLWMRVAGQREHRFFAVYRPIYRKHYLTSKDVAAATMPTTPSNMPACQKTRRPDRSVIEVITSPISRNTSPKS